MAGGFTRDISEVALYIMCSNGDQPNLEDETAVDVILPSVDSGAGYGMRFTSVGRVSRLSRPNEACGFAVAVRFGFEEPAPKTAES